jgi:hypothetical protein
MGPRRLARETARWARVFFTVAIHPRLWWIAARQALRIARPRWWRQAPFLPLPDPEYLRFRLETAYGEVIAPRPADLIAYLEWCGDRAWPASGRRR